MKSQRLMTREAFRNAVFSRDGHCCVFCQSPAVDAHHIIERRLWSDGGYYIDNGASVCEKHHLDCEMTLISVEEARDACGITTIVLPEHLYGDHIYDKWGNPVLSSGQRLKGELFFDDSVQKILKLGGVLNLFTDKVKYPRTYHLPWSQGLTKDDRQLDNLASFEGQRVIVTEKMDGENTSMYASGIHARSIDGRNHPSRNWVKNYWSNMSTEIPAGWRICGENLYAKHSIAYNGLPSFFMGFSVWNELNVCLGWDETLEWFELLGIQPVPVLYDAMFSKNDIRSLWSTDDWNDHEGYVIRLASSFAYGEFRKSVAKFVRKGHANTVPHWMHGKITENNQMENLA